MFGRYFFPHDHLRKTKGSRQYFLKYRNRVLLDLWGNLQPLLSLAILEVGGGLIYDIDRGLPKDGCVHGVESKIKRIDGPHFRGPYSY